MAKGWYRESRRHSMARRGVTSKAYGIEGNLKARGIEDMIFEHGLPVNGYPMIDRFYELLDRHNTNSLDEPSVRRDPDVRKLLWLINQDFYGQLAKIDMEDEWDYLYATREKVPTGQIEDQMFLDYLPVNTKAMLTRLRELLDESHQNSIKGLRNDVRASRLMWLINSQYFGGGASIDMDKEWNEMYQKTLRRK